MAPQWSSEKPCEPNDEPGCEYEARSLLKAIHETPARGMSEVRISRDVDEQRCLMNEFVADEGTNYEFDVDEQRWIGQSYCFTEEDPQPSRILTSASVKHPGRNYLKTMMEVADSSCKADHHQKMQGDAHQAPAKGLPSPSLASNCSPTTPPHSRLRRTDVKTGSFKMDTPMLPKVSASARNLHSFPIGPASHPLGELRSASMDLGPASHPLGELRSASMESLHRDFDFELGSPPRQPSFSAPTPHSARTFSKAQTRPSGIGVFAGALCPGDVLSVVSEDNAVSRIGVSGGFMGHVLLVVSELMPVSRHSYVGRAFDDKWSTGGRLLYSVDIVECSRSSEGLYEPKAILSLDKHGKVILVGECDGPQVYVFEEVNEVHVWHSPPAFRKENFRLDVMKRVLADMRSNQQNWSWSTAVRAVFFSSEITSHIDTSVTMREIQDSWQAQPICTSIVVIFWQRYLHHLTGSDGIDPLHSILQVMPLRADRVLPGELFRAMLSRGWSLWKGRARSETLSSQFQRSSRQGPPRSGALGSQSQRSFWQGNGRPEPLGSGTEPLDSWQGPRERFISM